MDFTKLPVEKLFYFLAGIIPGFVALLIFQFAVPGAFDWFFASTFLGYKTKLSLAVLVCFVVGNTLTTFLNGFLGAIGGVVGHRYALRPYKQPSSYDVAPWRDPMWRMALRKQLGVDAPNDTRPLSEPIFKQRCEMVSFLPRENQTAAFVSLNQEKLSAEIDDARWAAWYDHYHYIVLFPRKRDFVWHVANGLNFNLQATSLYVLVSALVVRQVRHWWCIVPACIWLLFLFAESYAGFKSLTNQWSTLTQQTIYLTEEAQRWRTSEEASEGAGQS